MFPSQTTPKPTPPTVAPVIPSTTLVPGTKPTPTAITDVPFAEAIARVTAIVLVLVGAIAVIVLLFTIARALRARGEHRTEAVANISWSFMCVGLMGATAAGTVGFIMGGGQTLAKFVLGT
jgi:tellurite resistance protein TehA-like permease